MYSFIPVNRLLLEFGKVLGISGLNGDGTAVRNAAQGLETGSEKYSKIVSGQVESEFQVRHYDWQQLLKKIADDDSPK